MAAQKHEIEISADPRYSDSEIEELAREFEYVFRVHTKKYERFAASDLPLILVIVFGLITRGFFEEIGKDVWQTLKKKLVSTVSNRNEVSEVRFHYSYQSKKIELRVASADANVIASAFDHIETSLEVVEKSQKDRVYLQFNSGTNGWNDQMVGGQKVALRFQGVAATTGSATARGRSYKLTEESLKKAAKDAPGTAIGHGHGGRFIGKVEDAWYENGKLMVRGVVFEPTDDEGRAILNSIKAGDLKALSIEFSFDSASA
jgi:hypothetical protein